MILVFVAVAELLTELAECFRGNEFNNDMKRGLFIYIRTCLVVLLLFFFIAPHPT